MRVSIALIPAAAALLALTGCGATSSDSSPSAGPTAISPVDLKSVVSSSLADADATGLVETTDVQCTGGNDKANGVYITAYDPKGGYAKPVVIKPPQAGAALMESSRPLLLLPIVDKTITEGGKITKVSDGTFTVADMPDESGFRLPDPGYTVTVKDGHVDTISVKISTESGEVKVSCAATAAMTYSPSSDAVGIVAQYNATASPTPTAGG